MSEKSQLLSMRGLLVVFIALSAAILLMIATLFVIRSRVAKAA